MKCLITLILLAATCAGSADAQQNPELNTKEQRSGAVMVTERNVAISAAPPCQLARAVAEQLGWLAPQVKPLPNSQAFGAANGRLKVIVACGMSADETYTYHRLLSNLGISLLAFKGDEAPQKVVQDLADRLKISYQHPASYQLPLTYAFAGQGAGGKAVRLTIQAAKVTPTPIPATAPARQALPVKASSESLLDLYLLAKASDPDLGRSRSRYLASQADVDVVRASLRPHVNADFGFSYLDQSTYNSAPTTLTSNVFGYNYDVIASMPVLHFPIYYNMAASAALARSDELGVVAARQNLISKLGQAYFNVLKSRADQQIAKEEISRVKQALEQAQAFLKAGTGDIIAVYEAQARLDSVLADLNKSESTLSLADQRLSSIVGKVVPSIVDYQHLQPKSPEPNNLEWWLATMEKKDPQIRQAQEGLESSIQQTKSSKAEHLPVIDANAGFDVEKGAAYAPGVETRQWHIGATVTVPLYSGGETSARIRRAAANETERSFTLDQVREQRRDNIKQAFFNLTYNVSLIRALEQRESSALLQLDAIKKGRSIGTRTAIDLLNGQQAYSMAQRDLKSALYDNVLRVIELRAAAGILSEDDITLK